MMSFLPNEPMIPPHLHRRINELAHDVITLKQFVEWIASSGGAGALPVDAHIKAQCVLDRLRAHVNVIKENKK
jgi:hypothetical protein